MRQERVDILIWQNKEKIPAGETITLRNRLTVARDEAYDIASCVPIKSPILTVIFSLFLGPFGIDRFYIGDIGKGLLKLLYLPIVWVLNWVVGSFIVVPILMRLSEMEYLTPTDMFKNWFLAHTVSLYQLGSILLVAALLGWLLWWIIDCFCSYKKAKEKNLENLLDAVQPYIYAQPQTQKNGW